jgi:hypothetical protein
MSHTKRKLPQALESRGELIADLERMPKAEWLAHVVGEYFSEGLEDADANTAVVEALSNAMANNERFLSSHVADGGLISFTFRVFRDGESIKSGVFTQAPGPVELCELALKNAEVGDRVEVVMVYTDATKTAGDYWPFDLEMAEELLRPIRGSSLEDDSDQETTSLRMRRVTKRIKIGISTVHGPPKWKVPHINGHWKPSDEALFFGASIGWRLSAISVLIDFQRKAK